MSLAAGLVDPVHGTQAVFRHVLDAMSRPGRVHELPAGLFEHPSRPALPLGTAAAAVLLTLCDAETTLWWSPGPRLPQLHDWARFHSGVRWVDHVEDADMVGLRAGALTPALWARLRPGSDVAPHTSATLIVEVDALQAWPQGQAVQHGQDHTGTVTNTDTDTGTDTDTDIALHLQGPGIEQAHHLRVAGISRAVWQARMAQSASYPCGVDLLLCCGTRVVGLPRSTHLTWLDT